MNLEIVSGAGLSLLPVAKTTAFAIGLVLSRTILEIKPLPAIVLGGILITYLLHWKGGKDQRVTGTDIADACHRAGIGMGAIPALDWYEEVAYEFDVRLRDDSSEHDLGSASREMA